MQPIKALKTRYQNLVLKYWRFTPYARYLKKIKNTHQGESCFIIGHGPSLTAADLDTLHDKGIDCFGVNRVFKIFPQTRWRPTYYVNTDAVLIRDCQDIVDDINAEEKFIPIQNHYYLDIDLKNVRYFKRNDVWTTEGPEVFSTDITNELNIVGTVTMACMQIAMHLGYTHIYLLGVDHSFDKVITESGEIIVDPGVKNYFVEGYDDDISNEVVHNLGKTTKRYLWMAKFADAHGIEIVNATRTTKLTAFRQCTFEEALEEINSRR